MIKSLGFFPSTKTTQYLPCKRFGFNQMISTFFGEKDSVQSISKHSLTAKLWPYKNLVKIWWLMRFSVCHVTFIYFSNLKLWNATLRKIWSFPLKISSVNVTKSVGYFRKLHFLCSVCWAMHFLSTCWIVFFKHLCLLSQT